MEIFIKVLNQDDELVSLEVLDPPNWVTVLRNGTIALCDHEILARGVQDATGSTIYQLAGREPIPDPDITLTATIITEAEYDELSQSYHPPDPEPDDPEPEDPEPDDPNVMTRAELTERVLALTEELAAAKILLGVE